MLNLYEHSMTQKSSFFLLNILNKMSQQIDMSISKNCKNSKFTQAKEAGGLKNLFIFLFYKKSGGHQTLKWQL